MNKVLVIVGPTASGKSAFGIECAQAFNGEIISGDSIQIYKGLDIGSAKASKTEQAQVKHHLIDIKEANDNYSVKEFQELGRSLIDDIVSRNKLPIIVGGTGLYIKALLYDYEFFDEEEPDNQYEDLSNEELYELLRKKDPRALEKIHLNNRKRLVRAINIYDKHAKGISEIKDSQEHKLLYNAKIIGLTMDRDKLYQRIEERVDLMIKDGLVDEINGLLNSGISFNNQAMQAIGYREFSAYFKQEKSLEETIDEIKRDTKHFAKRQYTFFKNQFNVDWYEDKKDAYNDVKKWYEQ